MITIGLDYNSKTPLYEQIYKFIRDEIKNQNIVCREKLPSSRSLAAYLSVSRNTIDMAYAQLLAEGYIMSVEKKGYYVCELEGLFKMDNISLEKEIENIDKSPEYNIDFSPMGVDMNYFPYNKWRSLLRECMIDDNREIFQSGDSLGDIKLRRSIKKYLRESRGVNCSEEQIIIGAGSDYLLLLLSLILGSENIVAIENPTYVQAYKIFQSQGLLVKPISVGNNGLCIEELKENDANIVYVTPSHQYPLGVVMPIKRRMELLNWAKEYDNRYIIEDDYDSEFRYFGKPIPALQGIDSNNKVIYIGTLSKAIAPAIRIAYMVLPNNLLKPYKEKAGFYLSTVSRIDQTVISKFIDDGYFERHLNKMRGIYRIKHDKLMNEINNMNLEITILGESAGLHLLLEFNQSVDAEKLILLAKKYRIKVYSIKDYYIFGESNRPIIIMGFARLSEEEIVEGVAILKKVWGEYLSM